MSFTGEQIQQLAAPLDGSKVKTRPQGRQQVSYLEGWQVIDFANEVFGFDGWSRETVLAECVSQQEKNLSSGSGWGVTYTAKVKVTVGNVVREGFGAGSGNDRDLGQAHESAIKEAETDAMKRALMTFGYGFGLALYDKTQANVENGNSHQGSSGNRSSSTPKPSRKAQSAKPSAENTPFVEGAKELAQYGKENGLTAQEIKGFCSENNLPTKGSDFTTKAQVDTLAALIQDAIQNKSQEQAA